MSLLLGLLPLLAGLLVGSAQMFEVIHFKSGENFLCRSQALQVQNQLSQHLDELLALNPRARRLRRSYEKTLRASQEALKSGLVKLAAALAAAAAVIYVQRLQLDAQQRIILAQAQHRVSELRTDLQHRAKAKKQVVSVIGPKRGLAVTEVEKTKPGPEFRLARNFEEAQVVQIKWLGQHKLTWLPTKSLSHFTCDIACAATIANETGGILPTLRRMVWQVSLAKVR